MKKIGFYIALWAGKLLLFIWKLRGREQDDKPGMGSMRLCADFLKYVAKPELTICVTGTNGKSSISSMVADMLKRQGKTVSYNNWGANHHAGQAWCFLNAVNIFNKPTKDVIIIESDELISPINFPKIKPDYIIINNLARDSMLRNANPEYIADQLRVACEGTPNSVVIINADDPLCCFLGEKNRRVYFGADDLNVNPYDNIAKDFAVCPKCGAKVKYIYRNYRHIGQFECNNCGIGTPDRDYFALDVSPDGKYFSVEEKAGGYIYPVISEAVHNIYNTTAIIALMRDMGNSCAEVADLLKETQLPQYRETHHEVDGTEIICRVAKGQNATAVSTIFEQVAKDPDEKQIIIILDEPYENPKKLETIAWLYDTDYEFLNKDNIKRIIIGGLRHRDHRLRLLIAGIPQEKIFCTPDFMKTPDFISKDVNKIYVLHDVNCVTIGHNVREVIRKNLTKEGVVSHES